MSNSRPREFQAQPQPGRKQRTFSQSWGRGKGHAWNWPCQFLQGVRELAWGWAFCHSPLQNLPARCVPDWRLTALSQLHPSTHLHSPVSTVMYPRELRGVSSLISPVLTLPLPDLESPTLPQQVSQQPWEPAEDSWASREGGCPRPGSQILCQSQSHSPRDLGPGALCEQQGRAQPRWQGSAWLRSWLPPIRQMAEGGGLTREVG